MRAARSRQFQTLSPSWMLKLAKLGGDAAAGGVAVASDATINRYRPYMVHAEHHDGSSLTERAQWEVNMRVGRGNRGRVQAKGWSHKDGAWRKNMLVPVYSPMINLDAEMLIVSCLYTIAEGGGTVTNMTIAPPGAFELLGGVGVSKLGKKLRERDKHEKTVKGDDWSGL
jgi:prophage tail gpP-like protein